MLPTPELNAMALKIMQKELAERRRDRVVAARDAQGHPPRSSVPFFLDELPTAA